MKRITALVGVFVATLVLPGIAFATSSTCQQYSTLCSTVGTNSTPAPTTNTPKPASRTETRTPTNVSPTTATNAVVPVATTTTTSVNPGTLPFTGLDVVLLVVGGCALLSAGFAVRRVSRRLN